MPNGYEKNDEVIAVKDITDADVGWPGPGVYIPNGTTGKVLRLYDVRGRIGVAFLDSHSLWCRPEWIMPLRTCSDRLMVGICRVQER